ncbi:sensor histidine kinase [Marinifilum caeruleilacunae]|uniref:histidine kinase n=1 Tax=Marinifilum caeruleilacunae TaxID=2499076 RepID=A0ABX1WVB7_9BACT|nr:HAMP domain-containing sensor histidine kinase [Marinifilum caeruleilacunae]NOU59854.1 HAMP domain-containing histidine kinase [Marinifilum caeruleilacunae]
MDFYLKNRNWKYHFLIVAVLIIAVSILYTNSLVEKLAHEEAKKVELWAFGLQKLELNTDQDVELINRLLEQNETIPVILTDEEENIIDYRHITVNPDREEEILRNYITELKDEGNFIEIQLVNSKNYIYYDSSNILKRLAWYPFVQLGAIVTFIIIAFLAFSYSKSAEQNRVWVGMSKETAHQLGTPISSLMAWMELMKSGNPNPAMVEEMSKDVTRLEVIAERFSKIGSKPILKNQDVREILESSIEYLKKRTSGKIDFIFTSTDLKSVKLPLNKELFSWVIENLTKNAVDAMEGRGELRFSLSAGKEKMVLDIKDTGKGIAKSQFKTVFKPGYTSKKRGWGLGLSLAKRIIENYHDGKIFVASSELGKGTVFRIILPLK